MGGSSLCRKCSRSPSGKPQAFPRLHILDSTDPAQIRSVEKKIDFAKTLFIVSSKSGSTLEPNIYKQYFFERVQQTVSSNNNKDKDKAGSPLYRDHRPWFEGATGRRARSLPPDFLRPAVDRRTLLRALKLWHGSSRGDGPRHWQVPHSHTRNGRGLQAVHSSRRKSWSNARPDHWHSRKTWPRQDYAHHLAGIGDLGAWLEQLIAESTGKLGKGIIPVDREALGAPDVYGNDRSSLPSAGERTGRAQDAKVTALEKAGHPIVRIAVSDIYNLGQEFLRWEIATAVAGSILGINAFNQPDVEASKS